AARAAAAKVDPPKPPMPKIDAAKPPMPAVALSPDLAKSDSPQPAALKPAASAAVALKESEPAAPTSSDIARAQPKPVDANKRERDAGPATTVDQVKAIQALLRDLRFSREAPDGVMGPATRAAIRDYERSLGLAETGQPSKTLFESLKEIRSLTTAKSN